MQINCVFNLVRKAVLILSASTMSTGYPGSGWLINAHEPAWAGCPLPAPVAESAQISGTLQVQRNTCASILPIAPWFRSLHQAGRYPRPSRRLVRLQMHEGAHLPPMQPPSAPPSERLCRTSRCTAGRQPSSRWVLLLCTGPVAGRSGLRQRAQHAKRIKLACRLSTRGTWQNFILAGSGRACIGHCATSA